MLLLVGEDSENNYSELYRDSIFLLVGLRSAPTVEAEIALSCALVFTGTLSAGWILSSMLLAMDFARSGEIQHRAKVARLQSAIESLEMPSTLKKRILCYKAYCHTRKNVGALGSLFEDLSRPLHLEMRLYLYANLVMSVPFLKNACVEFIKQVTLALEEQLFLPSDFIIVAGEHAREMYFLTRGTVSVFSADRENRIGVKITELTSSSQKAFFGEVGLLSDARRIAHVRANTYVVCTCLSKPIFRSLLEDFPAEAKAIELVANERGAEVVRVQSKEAKREASEASEASATQSPVFSPRSPPSVRGQRALQLPYEGCPGWPPNAGYHIPFQDNLVEDAARVAHGEQSEQRNQQ
jgi:CRP-like cAMP-binding protein